MGNIIITAFVIFTSVVCFGNFSYAETDDSTITLTCSYTSSNDIMKKSSLSNSIFNLNISDQTARSEIGTEFTLTATDSMFKLDQIIRNNVFSITIDRLTGELDGYWIINDNEYKMSGECNKKSTYLKDGVIISNLRPISD